MLETKNTSPTKTFPFNKTIFVRRYERPTFVIRIVNFVLGIRAAFKSLRTPAVDEYNHYPFVYIWGNLSNSNLYTNDDISILYNVKEKMYYLKVNTSICADINGYLDYLEYTLQCFTIFMRTLNLNMEYPKKLFGLDPKIELKAQSLEELYTEYNLFVNGYFALYAEPESEPEDEDDDEEDDDDI